MGEVLVDVAVDEAGFSVEATAEEVLSPAEAARLEAASEALGISTIVVDGYAFRGLASVEDDTLWVTVHASSPGRFDDEAARAAQVALRELWGALHQSSAA